MEVGCSVVLPNTPELGIGKVVKQSRQYITVYFSDVDENREFLASKNALVRSEQISKPSGKVGKRLLSEDVHGSKTNLGERVERDQENAVFVSEAAMEAAQQFKSYSEAPTILGSSESAKERELEARRRHTDLMAIRNVPFHVMAEIKAETLQNEKKETFSQLLYAHEDTRTNNPLVRHGKRINVMSWTHPAIQIAMTGDLRETVDIKAHGYTLRSVTPVARAKFSEVLPALTGLYEPGGMVGTRKAETQVTGLKAVKLQMTRNQVEAFLSKMNGMMLVTGAPGSGKTTVAMQRIRFLYDQQDERLSTGQNVRYADNLTKIFLANENLVAYSKDLLEKGLQIPSSIVEPVDGFISGYLNDVWSYKHGAAPRRKKLFYLEERARMAFYGLCSDRVLRELWQSYEGQIATRLAEAEGARWLDTPEAAQTSAIAERLAQSLRAQGTRTPGKDPLGSRYSMDALYREVRKEYEEARVAMQGIGVLSTFDSEFHKWLFWVYDPLDCLFAYFGEQVYDGKVRIKKGMAAKIDEERVVEGIREDWENRSFGREEIPWLAFLLRFALPSETDQRARFREMPNPLAVTGLLDGMRWTHVMVDEAQDLCVAQAALLGSLVHPDGAFTVSADFHQIVSPVWGMETPEAFKVGISLRDKGVYQSFPFAKNMRQSRQVGLFLQSFYQSVFGEIAPFEVNDQVEGSKPLLILSKFSDFAVRIHQRLNVLRRSSSIRSIALLQVNEDETAMEQIRASLESRGVVLAPLWAASDPSGRLITTSVERIKGLEYDACFVIGLDDDENRNLNFAKNRAYVALSRPALQLVMFCEELPRALQKVNPGLMDIIRNQ
ncbi:hypothetical protein GEOBRER4_n2768 [Citrifermentans bremense]|uniref:DNA helicase n=1 Tax=Citrifermentans bremense TaxID=60035 RepID=A0A6S6M0S4_9BACT|nr:hypothetical protein [Citrifermentans bremense]BCG47917.1 hypothetical protein GEOBRER4_n2768 [Citrifermentans bremense]